MSLETFIELLKDPTMKIDQKSMPGFFIDYGWPMILGQEQTEFVQSIVYSKKFKREDTKDLLNPSNVYLSWHKGQWGLRVINNINKAPYLPKEHKSKFKISAEIVPNNDRKYVSNEEFERIARDIVVHVCEYALNNKINLYLPRTHNQKTDKKAKECALYLP